MLHWNDFNDNKGFNDGSSYPKGVAYYLDVYCRAMNVQAELNGSEQRVVPVWRDTIHNEYVWFLVLKEWYEVNFLPKIGVDELPHIKISEFPGSAVCPFFDDGMQEAYDLLIEADLDAFVKVKKDKVEIFEKGFKNFLRGLMA